MTVSDFLSICREERIVLNSIIRIRIIRPKRFFGFFRKLTGITIEGKLHSCSTHVEIMAADDNGEPIMHHIDYKDIVAVKLIKH